MDVEERIARRQSARRDHRIVVDRNALGPTVHRENPVGRGPVLEEALDVLEPIFEGDLPPSFAVVGPPGSGTSAVVTALFGALNDRFGGQHRPIGTTTRAGRREPVTWFVYVDGRRIDSPFTLYRATLSAISAESVPESGVSTDELREGLSDRLSRSDGRAVVAFDHHDEPGSLSYARVDELLDPVSDRVRTVAVGTREPEEWAGQTLSVPAYRDHELVEVLTDRTATGLAAGALGHESIRDLAGWADGNAHDALAGLFGAAVLASERGGERISAADLEAAIADVPQAGVHVDRALSLSDTRRRVLLELVSIDSATLPIRDVASSIAERSSLTTGTVKRLLYELADCGVLERVPLPANGSGRRPSTVDPRIPTIVYRALAADER